MTPSRSRWWPLAAVVSGLFFAAAYGIYLVSAAHGHGLAGDDPLAIIALIVGGVIAAAVGVALARRR